MQKVAGAGWQRGAREGEREHLWGNLYPHLFCKFKKPKQLARVITEAIGSPRMLGGMGAHRAGLGRPWEWDGKAVWARDI